MISNEEIFPNNIDKKIIHYQIEENLLYSFHLSVCIFYKRWFFLIDRSRDKEYRNVYKCQKIDDIKFKIEKKIENLRS